MATTPCIKFESSPSESLADSFTSTPGTQYSSLFPDTMDPSQVMTPQSYDEESMFGDDVGASLNGTPAPEKKPVKKRKSWGQQLPEPKTNLPPRKRAKTEDEKEQRRVERVLRNRRAAQSSRERKRQEVEALEEEKRAIERRNQDLEARLADMQAKNLFLQRELDQITGGNMRVFQGSSAISSPVAEVRNPVPITFSQDLFGSRDEPERSSISTQSIAETRTVNPASLSPEIRPVADSTKPSSSDMTQHPAVSVGRTGVLDEYETHFDLADYGNGSFPSNDISHYLDAPNPSESDHQLSDLGINTTLNLLDTSFNHMDDYNNCVTDEYNFDDYLHHDDQHAPEIQSSDPFAETTASLQPQFGASTYGCDDGGNAVSV